MSRRRSKARAQDRLIWRGFFALLLCAGMGALLILEKGALLDSFKLNLRDLSYPGLETLTSTWNGLKNWAHSIASAPALGKKIQTVEAELDRMKLVAAENQRLSARLSRLEESLGYQKKSTGRDMLSRVVAVDPEGWYRSVWIDRGIQDGLKPGTICWTPQGLAGRIVKLDTRRSQVMVITDPDFRVSAILADSRLKGFVRGRGGPELDFVSLEKDPIFTSGEWVYSSGLGGLFPPGMAIGRITGSRKGSEGISKILTLMAAVNPPRLERIYLKIPPLETGTKKP